jgi:hypothetical protein
MKFTRVALLAATLLLIACFLHAQALPSVADIVRAVVAKISSEFGIHSEVIRHLDLTEPFKTNSRWSLVVAKQPDEESQEEDGAGNRRGSFSLCFVQNEQPNCSEAMFLAKYREENIGFALKERPFYELFLSDIVFSDPGRTLPLLRIKGCTMPGANGNCGVSTFLFAYDPKTDNFRPVFFNMTGRNNNQEARFIENGPLLGSVIFASPTTNAPFGYFIEVFKRVSEYEYSLVLKYRSNTRYGDGNPLAVIDSEMPETLRRLGLWKEGDALPVPARMPLGCSRLVMRKGVEWCEPN